MLSKIKLNCDLGEGHDDIDRKVMPFIDQANIACGGHAGDRNSIKRTIELALRRNVSIGAHPSYPDRENFGRVSIPYTDDTLLSSLLSQVNTLKEACDHSGASLGYIKAHGALYNDSMKNPRLMTLLLKLAKSFQCGLMVQALPNQGQLVLDAQALGVNLLFEGFADRAYDDNGFLVPRTVKGAVYESADLITLQAVKLATGKPLMSCNNQALSIRVDSICVHGDTDKALESLQRIYDVLH